MKIGKLVVVLAATSLALPGCSSKPRPFAPTLAAPPADQRAFDLAQARCADAYVKGKLDKDGRLGSAGAGIGVGAAAAGAGTAAAAATAGYAGLAVASMTVVLLPFAVLGGAFGMSRMKRAAKEKAVKQAMEGCLRQQGFEVTGWTRMSKAEMTAMTERFEVLRIEAEQAAAASNQI